MVVNPFAPFLSFPTQPLEMRREHEKYLSLIDALALLHQHQRVRGVLNVDGRQVPYVEAAAADVREANRLMTAVLGQVGDALSGPSRDLLAFVRRYAQETAEAAGVAPEAVTFTRRQIREFSGWADWQIKEHIGQLEELELLSWRRTGRGTERTYSLSPDVLAGEGRAVVHLTDPDELPQGQKLGAVGRSRPVGAAQIVTVNEGETRAEVGK